MTFALIDPEGHSLRIEQNGLFCQFEHQTAGGEAKHQKLIAGQRKSDIKTGKNYQS